jgi:dihydroorotase
MNILFKQAYIISESSQYHHKTMDVLVEGGIITSIKKSIQTRSQTKVVEASNLCLSLGWFDMQVVSCDPGFEHKEDLDSLVKCAAAGGFTAVCVHNYNQPPLHNKSQIEYIINKTKNKIVNIYPLGTITNKGEGTDLSEMFDMQKSGAIGFSNYKQTLNDAGTCSRAIQYANSINANIITHCNDQSLSYHGQMNEGQQSTMLGLKGIPALAEELMLQRNISILEYTGGKLHIPTISTKGSVELIKKAKAAGLKISCGVSAINLLLDDSVLSDFDTNYKLNPPLRSKKDVQALRNAVENGIIDVIVSDHLPQDTESKELEFDLAEEGIINLQTAYNCALEGIGEKNIDTLINAFTKNPRQILNLNSPTFEEGAEANLTAFSYNESSVFSAKNNHSKSSNSPFFNKIMKGKVYGIVNGYKNYFN